MWWLKIVLLFLAGLLFSAPTLASLPDDVTEAGERYRSVLFDSGAPALADTERAELRQAAGVLSRLGQCRQALDLRRLVLPAGASEFADWLAQADDGLCARDWSEAVGAAHQAYLEAETDRQRFQALQRLGRAVDQDWRFGAAEVLAVYDLALVYGSNPRVVAEVVRLREEQRGARSLRLERIEVDRSADQPSLCLQFNHEMPSPQLRQYGDYVRVEPHFALRFRQRGGNEICIDGADYGREYRVAVLAGLTDAEGREHQTLRRESVRISDRDPALRFQNHLYVLPKTGGGVPVHAINVPEAKLTLYRVDERNLATQGVRELFGTDLGSWAESRIEQELGGRIWSGSAELPMERNREQRVDLMLVDRLPSMRGVYVLTAEIPDREQDAWGENLRATQWLVVSDLGLSTYRGSDGLTVAVRGLGDARPRRDVQLELYARNNSRLASVATDRRGMARIPPEALQGQGGQEPLLLFASDAEGDFNFLDISRSPFDLSDRGVGGRAHPGPLDAFVHTERGVYRPGETVNVGLLLRDHRGRAAPALPVTLRLMRPDGTLAREYLARSEAAGGLHQRVALAADARTGRWQLLAFVDPEADPVGQTAFQVQAILPPRIEARFLDLPDAPFVAGEAIDIRLGADYLFGAPAAGLEVRSEVSVRADPNPFEGYLGYRFGPLDAPDDRVLFGLPEILTDDSGLAMFALTIEPRPDRVSPLVAELRSEVVDVDGRVVTAVASRRVDQGSSYLGVRVLGEPDSEGHPVLDEGSEARFEVVMLDAGGTALAADEIEYRLIEERIRYQWYRQFGQWHYRREVREFPRAEGSFRLAASDPARLSFSLDAGRYRLDLRDPRSGAIGSARVQLGWGGTPAPDDPPDRLLVSHDRASYQPGSTAVVSIEGTFDGPGHVVIASDRVLDVFPLTLRDGRGQVRIAMDSEWGAGVYALVTAFRPDDAPSGLGPRRAIGVTWLGMDPKPHTLPVALELPDQLRPGQTLEVYVTVPDRIGDESVYLTLSAVDEGLLQLTAHASPKPLAHYFGQRQLGLDVRDLYGRLLDGRRGQPGRIGSGAGAPGQDGVEQPPVEIVSLFSGVVALDALGRARVPFELPVFEGRLRLDAVAWSGQRLGDATARVTVRDPVVVQPSLPRFLGTGDRSEVTVTLFNAEGPSGNYRLTVHTGGSLEASSQTHELAFGPGERQVLRLPLRAAEAGIGRLTLKLEGPEGLIVQRDPELLIQPAFAREERRQGGRIGDGDTTVLGGDLLARLIPDTVTAQLSLDTRPQWDVAGLIRQLDLFPYGCVEQVASRAFPLLVLPESSQAAGAVEPEPQRMLDAVAQILDKQLENGAFTLWGGPGGVDEWVSVYALEFLGEARRHGVHVPDFAWERGLRWLRALVEYPETRDAQRMATQSYALYVLARNGAGGTETARHLLDRVGERLPGGLAAAQLGAALALTGDLSRVERAFSLAQRLERREDLSDYGSVIRDQAEILRLAALHAPKAIDLDAAVTELSGRFAGERWLSTQEQAALVRTAAALTGAGRALDLRLGDAQIRSAQGPLVLEPDVEALRAGLPLRNDSGEALWFALLVDGHPETAPEPLAQGLEIRRGIFSLNGDPVERDAVEQGAVLVVVLEGEALAPRERHQLLIEDPLPAGLEAESLGLEGSRVLDGLEWLGERSALQYSDALDDRLVAALDLDPSTRTFRVAYTVRAVSPGAYRWGPVVIEDMYKPRFRARGESGWLHVRNRP